jgi:hypothetical protein
MPLLEAGAMAWLLCFLVWFQGKEFLFLLKPWSLIGQSKLAARSSAAGAMDLLQALASVPFLAEAG